MFSMETMIKNLGERYEDVFSDNIGLIYESEYAEDAEVIINSALKDEGFPEEATMINTKAYLDIKPKINFEEWAEGFLDEKQVETKEEYDSINNDDLMYYVFDNLDKADVEVRIEDSLEEWLDEHGTVEYLAQEMENSFESAYLEEVIEFNNGYNDDINEKIRLAMREEGFSEDVDTTDVEFMLYDVRLTTTFEDFAEEQIMCIENVGGVARYLENDFYDEILASGYYDFEVEITSDVEEFEEE
ncbi:hypothetical protein [Staphylococcus aureus]|uniref:hypothetical protein n=1 Tax=Staphylococcus aureus TaxID=1280 RepID=UPI000DE482D0|nr:hypothetical protein [Staphylococcus aureus]